MSSKTATPKALANTLKGFNAMLDVCIEKETKDATATVTEHERLKTTGHDKQGRTSDGCTDAQHNEIIAFHGKNGERATKLCADIRADLTKFLKEQNVKDAEDLLAAAPAFCAKWSDFAREIRSNAARVHFTAALNLLAGAR